jgi:diguanylate cyclase (GGDEF)-like protein
VLRHRPQALLLGGVFALLLTMIALGAIALGAMSSLHSSTVGVTTASVPNLIANAGITDEVSNYRALIERRPPGASSSQSVASDRAIELKGSQIDGLLSAAAIADSDGAPFLKDALAAWRSYQRLTPGPSGSTPASAALASLHRSLAAWRLHEDGQVKILTATSESTYGRNRLLVLALVLASVLGVAASALWFLVLAPLHRASAAERFDAGVRRALELADNEDAALDVIGTALERAVPSATASELLLADSSDAHLDQAVAVGRDGAGAGCSVESPRGCAAVRRGSTAVWETSEEIDSCPKLKGREYGPCSAVCVPVTVLGKTIGVVHAVGREGRPPGAEQRTRLEATATHGGGRLGVIRAMAESQLQASTDPLTGLINRRSLEARVRDLRVAGVPYAVAMADLDRFKALNDTFGHETGDRALRLFARVLRETVRSQDVVARQGGEEFVVVLPGCGVEAATPILARVRDALKDALASGGLPAFTASFGLADTTDQAGFEAALRAADAALMRAKQEGRDRLVVADGPVALEPAVAEHEAVAPG